MSRLYIIGNGFDIAHEIPSKYCCFKKYCAYYMPEMYEKLSRYYDDSDKLWSDFEHELPSIKKDALFSWATVNNSEWNKSWNGYYKFIDEIRGEVDYIEGLKTYFTDWVKSISLDNVQQRYELPLDDCIYLNFNYTLTLEEVYHISPIRILHIHGKKGDNFPQLEVGHNVSNKDVDDIFSSDNVFEEEACKEVANLVKGWRKNTEGIIASHKNFFSRLGDVKDIYVLGHSMNDIDLPYFMRIKQGVPEEALWHISVFGKTDRERKEISVGQLDLQNVDYIRLEDLLLHREECLF